MLVQVFPTEHDIIEKQLKQKSAYLCINVCDCFRTVDSQENPNTGKNGRTSAVFGNPSLQPI